MPDETLDLVKGDPVKVEETAADNAEDQVRAILGDGEEGEAVEVAEEESGEDGPSSDHPRFKQVYGKLKDQERANERLKAEMELLKRNQSEQAQKQAQTEQTILEQNAGPEPVIDEDPQAWADFQRSRLDQGLAHMERRLEEERMNAMVNSARMFWSDYDDVVTPYLADIENNPTLKSEIFNSANPPASAYDAASRARRKDDTDRESLSVESPSPADEKPALSKGKGMTKSEKSMAKKMGLSDREWVENRSALDDQSTKHI